MRSSIKPPPTQSQSSKCEIESHLKSQHLNEGKTKIQYQEESLIFFLAEELQHGPTFIRKIGEKINSLGALDGSKLSQDTGKLEELNTKKFQMKGTNSNLTDKFNVAHKEVDREEEKSHQDLMRLTTFETPTVSGRMLDVYSGRQPPCNLFPDKQDSCGNPVIVESRRGIQLKNLQEINVGGASCHKFESLDCCEAKHSSFESSGAWIFPDEARRFCVTTGGKKVMDLIGGSSIKPQVQEGKLNLSMQENMEEVSQFSSKLFGFLLLRCISKFKYYELK